MKVNRLRSPALLLMVLAFGMLLLGGWCSAVSTTNEGGGKLTWINWASFYFSNAFWLSLFCVLCWQIVFATEAAQSAARNSGR